MAFYYVKSGGTATGDVGRETTARTGAFEANANNYPSIFAAMAATTTPTGSDFILCSSIHSHNYSATTTIVFPNDGNPIQVMSVDNANQENYLAGASEGNAGALNLDNMFYYKGVDVGTDSTIQLGGAGANGSSIFEAGTFNLTTSGDAVSTRDDGTHTRWINQTVDFAAACFIEPRSGSTIEWFGGSTTGASIHLIRNGFIGGGGTVHIKGVDLTAISGGSSFLLFDAGESQTADDTINVKVEGCQLNGTNTPGFVEEEFENQGQNALFTRCGNTTDNNEEYQVFQRNWGGDVQDEDDAGIHRNESIAYPDGTKVSLKFTSRSVCTPQRPIIFDYTGKFSELATASTDTIRIYFTVENGTTLTNKDVWAEVIYPDGTTAEQPNYLSNQHDNPLSAGTTHTTDSGSDWRDGGSPLGSFNEYYMDLDTSSDAGSDGVPIIRIYVGIASKTIYFDTSFDLVA